MIKCNSKLEIEDNQNDMWSINEDKAICSMCGLEVDHIEVYGSLTTVEDGEVYIVSYECSKCGNKELKAELE